MADQEITNPAELNAPRDVWVLMQMTGKTRKQLPRAKFNAKSLQAASIAVQHEVEARGYLTSECLGAVVFDAAEWTTKVAWIHRNGRVYSEPPTEWKPWLP